MKILFFGSTDFSLPIVQRLHEEFEILGVVASKPKPKGRGLHTSLPKVAQWAKDAGLNVYTPDDPNSDDFIGTLSQIEPDLFVLSAYGYILSGRLLQVARLGGINVHPSLLPRYRGAAPIQRAIMAGEEKTGITIFFMDEKIDHGKMLAQQEVSIDEDDTFGLLADKLAKLGADMIAPVLRAVESGNSPTTEQQNEEASYAPKLKKEELIIDWQRGAVKIHNQIRALSPRPGARTYFRNKELMITRAELGGEILHPGLLVVQDKRLHVGTGNGSLVLREVKPEGKRVISALDFINGYRIVKGEVLG
jgi:methionyl-tRNA formyltransferase